jgi:hypothetical protein
MAYVSQEMKRELAPKIKAVMEKYDIKGSLAVQNHSTLVLNVKSGKIDFIKNYNDVIDQRNAGGLRQGHKADGYIQVNPYWCDEHFTGKAQKFLAEVIAAMKGPKFFDHSDAMTDYFHVSHYIDINLGRWNKPYIVTK